MDGGVITARVAVTVAEMVEGRWLLSRSRAKTKLVLRSGPLRAVCAAGFEWSGSDFASNSSKILGPPLLAIMLREAVTVVHEPGRGMLP